MSRHDSYIGGSTIIRDPAFAARLARNYRKTMQSQKRRALERQCLAARLAAYGASNPQSELIKKSGQRIKQVVGTDEFDGGINTSSNQLERCVKNKSPKFCGSLQDLMQVLTGLGISGDWQEEPNRVWQFRCPDRAGMHWSGTKGTVWFDGPAEAKAALQAKVEPVIGAWTPRPRFTHQRLYITQRPSSVVAGGSGLVKLNLAVGKRAHAKTDGAD